MFIFQIPFSSYLDLKEILEREKIERLKYSQFFFLGERSKGRVGNLDSIVPCLSIPSFESPRQPPVFQFLPFIWSSGSPIGWCFPGNVLMIPPLFPFPAAIRKSGIHLPLVFDFYHGEVMLSPYFVYLPSSTS